MATGFGDRLKELREAAGLSQGQVAEAAGLHRFGVAKIERGEREPGWATVLAIATALNCTPNDFIPPPPPTRNRRRAAGGR